MGVNILLRRRKLGRTSCREISNNSFNPIKVIRNDRLIPEDVDYLFRWGCTSQCNAKHTINKVGAIEIANNKALARSFLKALQLPKPIIPKTWFDIRDPITTPCIVRPLYHAQGRKLFLCTNLEEVKEAVNKCGPEYYITEYIQKDKEFRVFVAQNRVVWITEKTPGNPADIAWNVARGGRFDNVRWTDWPLRACRIALQGMEAIGLDFGGVDIIQKGKEFYILEINSAPSQTSPYRQQCVGKVFSHIIDTENKKYPDIPKINSYRDCIHPILL